MATTVDELEVVIKATASNFNSQLDQVNKRLNAMSSAATAATSKISAGMIAMGTVIGNLATKVITSAFRTISNEMSSAVTRLDVLNNYPRVMSNLGIAAEDAEKSIEVLNEGILGLPTSLDTAAQATQRLTAVNGNIAASTEMFLALNNAILAGGAPIEMQKNGIEQLTQAYSKGRADAMEWRAMLAAMPAQMNQIAKSMGYTSAALGGDLQTALVEGEATMDDFMAAIMKLNDEGLPGFQSFAEQAKNSTAGVQTSISNLKIAIQRAIANIMGVLGQSNIAGFFNNVAAVVDKVSVYIAAFVKIIKEAVAWIGALFGGSGSTSEIVKQTGSASDNLAGAASSAGDTASNLGDAAGEAKKLAKTLAGFDEMNVLKESSDSGSGSSSGGSGGGSAFSDFNWDGSNLEPNLDKIEQAAEKLKTVFADLFGNFDTAKIGDALKQIAVDAQVFAEPIFQIVGDVWNSYIKPMIEWAGNSLLPSILNAIGGAMSFVGSILKSYWNKFFKPFVDDFLKPIAKWTGGKIVKVLDSIGDKLRDISKREDVVEIITKLMSAFTVGATAVYGWNAAATIASGIMGDLFNAGKGLPTLLENTKIGMAGITTGSQLYMAVATPLTNLISGIKMAFSSIWAVVSAHPLAAIATVVGALLLTNEQFRDSLLNLLGSVLTPLSALLDTIMGLLQPILDTAINLISLALTPMIGVIEILAGFLSGIFDALAPFVETIATITEVLLALPLQWLSDALAGINAIIGFLTGAMEGLFGWLGDLLGITKDNTEANDENKRSLSELEQQYDANEDGALDYAESVKYLNDCINNENKAEQDLIRAQQDQVKSLTALKEYTEKFNKTADELIQMHREGRLSELAQGEALDELKLAIIDVEQANYDVTAAQEKYNEEQGTAQSAANQTKERYDELGQELLNTTEKVGFLNENFDSQVEELKKLKEEIIKTGKNVGELRDWENEAYEAGRKLGEGLNNGAQCLVPESQRAGSNLGQGLVDGINWKGDAAWNAGYSLGRSAVSGLQAGTDSHSPSRAARKIGGFTGEGFALGIESEEKAVAKTSRRLGEIAVDNLKSLSDFSLDLPSVGTGSILQRHVVELGNAEAGKEPVHVTVKIGEDTLVDKIIEGINDASFMANRAVINA